MTSTPRNASRAQRNTLTVSSGVQLLKTYWLCLKGTKERGRALRALRSLHIHEPTVTCGDVTASGVLASWRCRRETLVLILTPPQDFFFFTPKKRTAGWQQVCPYGWSTRQRRICNKQRHMVTTAGIYCRQNDHTSIIKKKIIQAAAPEAGSGQNSIMSFLCCKTNMETGIHDS
uniref:Uncharacterized protein n=1 Tax=Branchiostoma floridae TaxID=7739 RepID=C3ZU82_BRAFL|eukprot:XP_002587957.1 hypothetical protein BRAFLDRAFT_87346 [Branchiostoma floridae]